MYQEYPDSQMGNWLKTSVYHGIAASHSWHKTANLSNSHFQTENSLLSIKEDNLIPMVVERVFFFNSR